MVQALRPRYTRSCCAVAAPGRQAVQPLVEHRPQEEAAPPQPVRRDSALSPDGKHIPPLFRYERDITLSDDEARLLISMENSYVLGLT